MLPLHSGTGGHRRRATVALNAAVVCLVIGLAVRPLFDGNDDKHHFQISAAIAAAEQRDVERIERSVAPIYVQLQQLRLEVESLALRSNGNGAVVAKSLETVTARSAPETAVPTRRRRLVDPNESSAETRAPPPPLDDLTAELQRLSFIVSRLAELVTDDSATLASARRDLLLVSRRIRECDFDCNGHGLTVQLPRCECVCVGGWHGPYCMSSPPSWPTLARVESPASIAIPLAHETLPPLEESREGCTAAANAYYQGRRATGEFRTDRALNFLWQQLLKGFVTRCRSATDQVIIIDVGAGVGEALTDWQRLGAAAACAGNDSLLILVEPNPVNLVPLRRRVALSMMATNRTIGRIHISDSAISNYNGVSRFAVNRKQNRGRKHGNDRGSLRAAVNEPSVSVIETRVERLGTLVTSLARPDGDFTIGLIKIDAEGYDAAVLFGASELLPRTDIIVFECHSLWHDAGFTLKSAVEFLAKHGFRTYLIGMFYWIPLTPPTYWDSIYEDTLGWSNCAAVRKGHPFEQAFTLPPPCQT